MKHPLLIPTPAIKKDPGSHVVRFLSTGKTRSCIRRACEKYCENQFEVTRLPEPRYITISIRIFSRDTNEATTTKEKAGAGVHRDTETNFHPGIFVGQKLP